MSTSYHWQLDCPTGQQTLINLGVAYTLEHSINQILYCVNSMLAPQIMRCIHQSAKRATLLTARRVQKGVHVLSSEVDAYARWLVHDAIRL
jgi:hypothetical protein